MTPVPHLRNKASSIRQNTTRLASHFVQSRQADWSQKRNSVLDHLLALTPASSHHQLEGLHHHWLESIVETDRTRHRQVASSSVTPFCRVEGSHIDLTKGPAHSQIRARRYGSRRTLG